jgi:hypothetical protein
MMTKSYITYDGKEIEVKEPTIDVWSKLTNLKDFTDNTEFAVELISISTGLSTEQIKQHKWLEILSVADNLTQYFLNQSSQFHREFEFEGVKYGFIDLNNLTFAEFIDIDSFLTKPAIERQTELHIHMALFYREIGEDGKLVKYDGSTVQARADKFKGLPIRYVNGALAFFFRLDRVLRRPTRSYLKNLMIAKTQNLKEMITRVSLSSGAGISRLSNWLRKTSQKYLRF